MKKRKIILILVLLAFLFIAGSSALIVYTERPEFCLTCHNMKPYYDSWKKSAHHQEKCIECHYAPGLKAHVLGKINGLVEVVKYLTGKYAVKPKALVDDLTCLRQGCHTREAVAAKKVIFKGKVEFEHAKHFASTKAGIVLNCTNCHKQLTNEEHISIDENTCFTCHFKNVEDEQLMEQCLKCHKTIKASENHAEYLRQEGVTCLACHGEVKSGKGEVLKQLCYYCHADKKNIEKTPEAQFMHQAHIQGNKADCRDCHHIIEHK